MSGRLIILPKKSYCPWNPKNVERVLRDERQHAEEQEQEQKRQQQEKSRARRHAFNNNKPSEDDNQSDDHNHDQTRPQHVNLFALEEEEHRKRLETALEDKAKTKVNVGGILPLYLGQSVPDKHNHPFYLTVGRKDDSQELAPNLKDDRLKSQMDPMKEFVQETATSAHTTTITTILPTNNPLHDQVRNVKQKGDGDRSRRRSSKYDKSRYSSDSDSSSSSSSSSEDDESSSDRRRRKRREQKRKRPHSKSSSSRRKTKKKSKKESDPQEKSQDSVNRNSIDEMRRRREEREQVERERQEALLAATSGHTRYQNQYHPRLSRN